MRGVWGGTASCWAHPLAFTSVRQTWVRAHNSGGRGQAACQGTQVGLLALVSEPSEGLCLGVAELE